VDADLDEIRAAADGVARCAQLVRHDGEELARRAVRRLGLRPGRRGRVRPPGFWEQLTSVADELDLLQGTLDVLILKTLSWGPRHGYAVARWIHQVSEDVLRVEDGGALPGAPPPRAARDLVAFMCALTDTTGLDRRGATRPSRGRRPRRPGLAKRHAGRVVPALTERPSALSLAQLRRCEARSASSDALVVAHAPGRANRETD
jgi:hypothetical protein